MNNDSNAPSDGQPSGGVSFGMTDMTVFRDPTLPPHVKLVYVALVGYASNERKAFPSHGRLAADCGLSPRAAGKAIKQGEAAGLWTITHTQSSNRYVIHDLGGSYEPGSGPLGTTCHLEPHDKPSEMAPCADELDQRTRPDIKTISTSSDAACGPLAAGEARPNSVQTTLKGKIDLRIPDNYVDMSEGMAMNQLIRSAFGALKKVGYVPAPDMRSRLTAGLRNTLDRGYSLEALYDLTVTSLEQIGGDGWWGDLAYPVRTEERKAS